MAQSATDTGRRYGYSQDWTDWHSYARFRPAYPASTVKLITDYHRAHSNSLRFAHDIGSGSGVFVPILAEYFQHVHISDSNPTNVSKARQRLGEWYQQNWWKAKFSFSVTAAEEACECGVPGSVDMATLMMSAHWTDVEAMVQSVGQSLAPNGTLAIVQYNPACTVVGNKPVNAVVQDLFQALGEELVRAAGGDKSLTGQRSMPQSNSGLDYVPLPEGTFIQDVTKRIKINVRGRGDGAFVVPGQEERVAPSRVGALHRKYDFAFPDEEADGWRQEVNGPWFRGFISSMEQEGKLQLFEEHFEAIDRKIEDTTAGGMVTIEWTVAILLATKK
ncbi:hypothetical protein LTR85_006079 [Meristemomyces frigidus]|nr:hypothetical protein LTR85_006079 [Meristemomyces frigidus]